MATGGPTVMSQRPMIGLRSVSATVWRQASTYASVRRFVATSGSSPPSRPGRSSPRPQVKKVKPITGTDRMVRDPASGKYRRTRLFTGSPAEAGMNRRSGRAAGL